MLWFTVLLAVCQVCRQIWCKLLYLCTLYILHVQMVLWANVCILCTLVSPVNHTTLVCHFYYTCHTTGPLQIQFVSGATMHVIFQYSETDNFCLCPVYPCQCFNDVLQGNEISIMWVKNVRDSISLNHINTLVPFSLKQLSLWA